MSNALTPGVPSSGEIQRLGQETNDGTGEKLKVNPRRILDSLKHLRIDIRRIKEIESTAESKSGGQGTVVPSILLPAGSPDEVGPNTTINHFIAVKKLRSGEDQDWDRVLAPFAYELQLLQLLSHDNIVDIIGFVEDAGTGVAWMVFNWEAHGNMREFVTATKLEIPERICLINDVACGLTHLHGMNPPICHGDLKSLNVLINSDLQAVITDFGSARTMASDHSNGATWTRGLSVKQQPTMKSNINKTITIRVEADCFTLTGQSVTIRWAAPEILEGGRTNLSTDIWAFGWICWEAITGNFPFHEQGESSGQDVQVILSILAGELPVLRDNSELKQIQQLCIYMEDCWSLDPVERPSALQCQQRLQSMGQARPKVRKPGMAGEAYSSGLLRSLGKISDANGRKDEAIEYFEQSLKIASIRGFNVDIAIVLGDLGDVHLSRDNYEMAEKYYTRAYDAFSYHGWGTANATRSLGDVHRMRGEYKRAEECYVEARDVFSQLGNKLGMANAVKSLGDVHQMRGDYTKAEKCYVQARDGYTQLENQLGTANAFDGLGDVHRRRGDYMKAEEYYIQASALYTKLGNQLGIANAVKGLGDVHRKRHDYTKAEECYVRARDSFSGIDDKLGMATASILLGDVYRTREEYEKAKEYYIAGRDIAFRIEYRWALNASAKGLKEIERVHTEPASE